MKTVRTFTVKPSLPEPLKNLKVIVNNMFWSWHTEITDIFRRIDYDLWKQHLHNPVKLLGTVSQARLEDLAASEGFVYQLQQAKAKLDESLRAPTWFDKIYDKDPKSAPSLAFTNVYRFTPAASESSPETI